MKYNLLLLGSKSFIGMNFYKLYKEKIKIYNSPRKKNLINKKNWYKMPKADTVLCLASKTFVPDSWINSDEFIKNNTQITLNALEYCRKNKSKLIFLSSYMYGDAKNIPTNEKNKINISNPYILSKKICEDLCRFYSKFFNVKVLIIRPFNIYGPNQTEKFLLPRIISQIKSGKVIVNDTRPKRDFLYIDDFCDFIYKSLKFTRNISILNLGSGKSYSVKDTVQILKKLLKSDLKIINKNIKRKNEILNTVASIDKAKKQFNWKPKTTFEIGLKKILKCENLI